MKLDDLNALLAVEQWDMPIDKLRESLDHTWGWITATDELENLIGFVRAISDGVTHAYIFHLVVHPDHRNQGLGTRLMRELMQLLGEHQLMLTLVSVPGKESFYERLGFATEMNGCSAMCIRGKRYWEIE